MSERGVDGAKNNFLMGNYRAAVENCWRAKAPLTAGLTHASAKAISFSMISAQLLSGQVALPFLHPFEVCQAWVAR
jgi:hypothetical protein